MLIFHRNFIILLLFVIFVSISFTANEPILVIENPVRATSLCFTGDAAKIVVGGEDGAVRVFDLLSGYILHEYKTANYEIELLDISRNDEFVAFRKNSKVAVLNVTSGLIKETTNALKAKFLSGSAKIALTYGRGGAGLWDIDRGEEYLHIDINSIVSPMDISPDDSILALGFGGGMGKDIRFGSIILWDLLSGERLHVLEEEITYAVESVDFSPSGRWILTGHGPSIANAEVNLWDVKTGKRIRKYVLNERARIAFNAYVFPDEEKIAAVIMGRQIGIFNLQTGEEIAKYHIGDNFSSFALSPIGNLYAVWNNGEIQIWGVNYSSDITDWLKNK